VSLEMLPARGRLTGFEAPSDASSPTVSRRAEVVRRREPRPEAVRIAISGCLPERSRTEEVEASIIAP
jgi:hypothetical protein